MNKLSPTTLLHDERGPPPHFAGRGDELATLRRRLEITLRERDAAVNGVLLISGIPSIGKTHLASHFVRQQMHSGTVEALVQGLTNLGVGVSEETAEQLAAASMRFPQHVHGHIEAACHVHKTRGEVDSTDAVAEALRRGRQARDRYYADRISATGMGAYTFYPLAEHLTDERQADITRANAEAIVGRDAVDAAVQHGVLTMGEHGLLSFGIPSFHPHMTRNATAYRERLARSSPAEAPTP